MGITEQKINLWVVGSSRIRYDEAFKKSLTKMWSAMFLREVCDDPYRFESLCQEFGFDRGSALELSLKVVSRRGNLRNFCLVSQLLIFIELWWTLMSCCYFSLCLSRTQALEKYWWYPPLALVLANRLSDAAKDDIKPLLALPRH
jgi:hypothetical protein